MEFHPDGYTPPIATHSLAGILVSIGAALLMLHVTWNVFLFHADIIIYPLTAAAAWHIVGRIGFWREDYRIQQEIKKFRKELDRDSR